MDVVPYVAAAQDFFNNHPGADATAAFLAGGMAGNPIACANLAFKVVDKIPPLRYLVTQNWPAISDFIDKFQERFGADVAVAATSDRSAHGEIKNQV